MDQLDSLYTISTHMIPWTVLIIALGGSAHCVGMCGGLTLSFAKNKTSNISYQLGRLSGYILLAGLASFFGEIIRTYFQSTYLTLFTALFMGSILIYWGAKLFLSSQLKMQLPKFWGNISKKVFHFSLKHRFNNHNYQAATIGFLSIFLPCGFLYGVVLVLAVFQNPLLAMFSMFCFWLGTLPALSFAPIIFQRVFRPIKNKAPLMSSIFLMSLGLITIGVRVVQYVQTGTCH